MSPALGSVLFGVLATCLAVLTVDAHPRWMRIPTAANHRGRIVLLALGPGIAVGYGVPTLIVAAGAFVRPGDGRVSGGDWSWLLLAMGIVFAAGSYDDRRPTRVHGVRRHFAELARGRVTSGIVKLLAAVAAATIVCLSSGASGAAVLLGIPLVAGTTNLFNLLDVAPGRALKFGFCAAVPLLIANPTGFAWASLGQSAALLPWDVREQAMLGDEGSNLLGFVLGFLLFRSLSTAGMAGALAIVLLLHVVAETVTLTRIIRATPPLRWIDDLWRIPAPDPSIG